MDITRFYSIKTWESLEVYYLFLVKNENSQRNDIRIREEIT